ncbi:hypothetical protein [Paenibacillus sp. WC2504]|uniref:hypothetical protein n=1 Tax=Paenibacillus sp. WC2504 TaxID=3461403 RepID=UPI004045CB3F
MKFCDVIYFEQIKNSTLADLIKIINNTTFSTVDELKLMDLVLFEDKDTFVGNGVYIFKNRTKEVVYIGKASSRPFFERLGGHFD